MRIAAAAIVAALLAWGAAYALAPATIDNSPLKPICDRLCGGSWGSAHPPAPDEFVTSAAYEWDPAMRAVHGTVTTTGGIAGVHYESVNLFGYDAATKTIWVMLADGDGQPAYGTVEITSDGFRETLRPMGDASSTMIANFTFTGPDEYTLTQEITAGGTHTVATPETYRRRK